MPEGPSRDTTSVGVLLDSTLESVDQAEDIVLGLARDAGFDEDELHKIGMAVREAAVNAVVHGNRYSANKKVHLEVSAGPEGLAISIGDEGDGFDPGALPDPRAGENLLRQSGRGLLLVQSFVDEFQVRRLAPHGTQVRLVKRLSRKT